MRNFSQIKAYASRCIAGQEELARYFAVSVAALAVDVICLFVLVKILFISTILSAAVGFILGSMVAFLLSTHWAFSNRRFIKWQDGLLWFIAIGIVGLLVNTLMMWTMTEYFSASLMFSKFAAASCSFATNFLMRKYFLYTPMRKTESSDFIADDFSGSLSFTSTSRSPSE